MLETGYPRNDRLVTATPAEVAEVRAELGLRPDQRVVLYMPTHRDAEAGYRALLDPDEVADLLPEDMVLLVRAHHFYRNANSSSHPRVRDVSAHGRVEDLYLAADVLITDYSSAMFDYAILDRPIVIYAPDWDAYRGRGPALRRLRR
jgi:CDP-glycerol glycerophosphotransferase